MSTTPGQEVENPRSVLQKDAAELIKEHHPAEEIIAGKIKRNVKGQITGIYVFWSSPSLPGKAKSENLPKVDPAEIDKIGRVFAAIRRQPADPRAAATVGFTFRGEDYLAKREPCISTGPHVRGAVCFSGSKPNLASKGIYAMMTQHGYVIIVKTKSFKTTQATVEGGKGLVHNVQSAAIKAAARK